MPNLIAIIPLCATFLLGMTLGLSIKNKTLTPELYDNFEVTKIEAYNNSRFTNGYDLVKISSELMSVCKKEAGRLARFGNLTAPEFESEISFRGFSVQIESVLMPIKKYGKLHLILPLYLFIF